MSLALDLLILLLFIAAVWYVISQAINSLDTLFVIKVDQGAIEKQFKEAHLAVDLKCLFKGRYALDGLKEIVVNIENKSSYLIAVDWRQSLVSDLSGRSREVVRVGPGLSVDFRQMQQSSLIEMGKGIRETLVSADVLKRQEDGTFVASDALINLHRLAKGSPKDKEILENFLEGEPLSFSLRIALRSIDPRTEVPIGALSVLCTFTLSRIPWTAFFPWN